MPLAAPAATFDRCALKFLRGLSIPVLTIHHLTVAYRHVCFSTHGSQNRTTSWFLKFKAEAALLLLR